MILAFSKVFNKKLDNIIFNANTLFIINILLFNYKKLSILKDIY